MTTRWPVAGTAWLVTVAVLFASGAGCGKAAQSTDDIARIVSRTGRSRGSVTVLLDDAAARSSRNSDDLARVLANAPAADSGVARAAARLEDSGIADDVAKGVVCDVLGEVALDPVGLDRDVLAQSVYSNVIGRLGGDVVSLTLAVDGIVEDIAQGTAGSSLWARVTLLKLQHCS